MASFGGQGTGRDNNSGTTLVLASNFTVTTGSLLVSYMKWEGTSGSVPSINDSTGGGITPFTILPVQDNPNTTPTANDLHSAWGYYLSHALTGSHNFRWTLDSARTFREWLLFEVIYTGVLSLDQNTINAQSGTTVTSGNITAASTTIVALGGYAQYTATVPANTKINGVASDQVTTVASSSATMWARLLSAGFTGAATGDAITSSAHNTGIISFKTAPTGYTMSAASGLYTKTGTDVILRPGSTTYLRHRK